MHSSVDNQIIDNQIKVHELRIKLLEQQKLELLTKPTNCIEKITESDSSFIAILEKMNANINEMHNKLNKVILFINKNDKTTKENSMFITIYYYY